MVIVEALKEEAVKIVKLNKNKKSSKKKQKTLKKMILPVSSYHKQKISQRLKNSKIPKNPPKPSPSSKKTSPTPKKTPPKKKNNQHSWLTQAIQNYRSSPAATAKATKTF